MSAAINIKHFRFLKQRAARLANHIQHAADGRAFLHHQRDIAGNSRELRQGAHMFHLCVKRAQHFQIDFRDDRPAGDFKRLHDVRMQLCDRRDALVACHQFGSPARMMIRLCTRDNLHLHAELRQHVNHDVANQIEIYAVAISADAQRRLLVRQIAGLARGYIEHRRNFIEHGDFVISALVEGNRAQHARHEGAAHDAGILAQRVGQLELIAARVICVQTEFFNQFRADEREIADFVKALRREDSAYTVGKLHVNIAGARGGLAAQHRGFDVLVAIDAQHFLGKIGFAFDILAEIRHNSGQRIAVKRGLEAQLIQNTSHFLAGNLHADARVDARNGGDNRLFSLRRRIAVVNILNYFARAQHIDQLAGAIRGFTAGCRAHAALVTAGSLCAQTQRAGRQADIRAVKRRNLEHDGRCFLGDFGFFAAHHARNAGRVGLIGDHQHIRRKRALLAVQRGDGFAGVGAAHDNVAVLHLRQIKSVHRVAGFQHHIVCDIDNIVDGTNAGGVQRLAHPHRRRADFHVANDARAVARAERGILHVDVHIVRHLAGHGFHLDFRLMEFGSERHGSLAGNAPNAEAIRAVG